MEIIPLGDSALIVRVREQFEDAPEEILDDVLRAGQRLRSAAIPGVVELAPSYTSVAVFFDPLRAANASGQSDRAFDWLSDRIHVAVAAGALSTVAAAKADDRGRRRRTARSNARLVEIPVCYDPAFAPDIDDVARQARISTKEVVDLHSAAEYRVACIGFVPGFPFLTGLAKGLATPRRDIPRKKIPAGSVGIGGAQTGIYPLCSPGGWNLIGRTPLRLFDPQKDPPALLRAGDHVRFRVITREEFESFNGG
jgi:inhibitor of KinA